jgi:hypothetical protein
MEKKHTKLKKAFAERTLTAGKTVPICHATITKLQRPSVANIHIYDQDMPRIIVKLRSQNSDIGLGSMPYESIPSWLIFL